MKETGVRFFTSARLGVLFCMLMVLVLGGMSIHKGHNWGDDFAMYIEEAEAMNAGSLQELCDENRWAMDIFTIGPYLYPPGFPTVLRIPVAIFGRDYVALKFLCLAFMVMCVPVLFALLKQWKFSDRFSLFVVALMSVSSGLVGFADNILSDFVFLFFVLLSVYLIFKHHSGGVFGTVLVGLVVFVTYSFRDVGLFLFGTLGLLQLRQIKEHRNLKSRFVLYALPYVVFVLCVAVMRSLMPANYAGNLIGLMKDVGPKDLWENAVYYFHLLGDLSFKPLSDEPLPILIKHVYHVFFWLLVGIGIYGFSKTRQWPVLAFLGLLVAMYIVWPWREGFRFVFPLFPFLLVFAVYGSWMVLGRWGFVGKKFPVVIAFALLAIVAVANVRIIYHFSKSTTDEIGSAEVQAMVEFVKQNSAEDDKVMFFKPRALRYLTGRKCFYTNDRNALEGEMPKIVIVKNLDFLLGSNMFVRSSEFGQYQVFLRK